MIDAWNAAGVAARRGLELLKVILRFMDELIPATIRVDIESFDVEFTLERQLGTDLGPDLLNTLTWLTWMTCA